MVSLLLKQECHIVDCCESAGVVFSEDLVEAVILFVCLFILAFDLYRSWRRTFCPVFLFAVRAAAARCKLPFTLRPGLSQEI